MVQNCNDHKPVDHNEQNPVTKRSDPLMNQERDYIWWTKDQSDTRNNKPRICQNGNEWQR